MGLDSLKILFDICSTVEVKTKWILLILFWLVPKEQHNSFLILFKVPI